MDLKIIEERMKKYPLHTKQDEKNAFREVLQEIALSALARADFFKHACFIGGSCLRIVHSLQRFSEDLDFWTLGPSSSFSWQHYLKVVQEEFQAFAIHMVIEDREQADAKIRRAFLKKDSIGKVLILSHARDYHRGEKLTIKFEIDTEPPHGAHVEPQIINFPTPFSITSLNRASLFASKIAALFDVRKEKGRHWYDFIWYIIQKWPINYELLASSLKPTQQALTYPRLRQSLEDLIQTRNWDSLKDDVRPFISPEEQETIALWSKEYFFGYLEELDHYLAPVRPSLGKILALGKGEKKLLEEVSLALSSGASVNDDSQNGHRPLQIAIKKGFAVIAQLLIQKGADLNYRDRSGLTPLQTAVNARNFQMAKILVESGAIFNPYAPNMAYNQTALLEFKIFLKQ